MTAAQTARGSCAATNPCPESSGGAAPARTGQQAPAPPVRPAARSLHRGSVTCPPHNAAAGGSCRYEHRATPTRDNAVAPRRRFPTPPRQGRAAHRSLPLLPAHRDRGRALPAAAPAGPWLGGRPAAASSRGRWPTATASIPPPCYAPGSGRQSPATRATFPRGGFPRLRSDISPSLSLRDTPTAAAGD